MKIVSQSLVPVGLVPYTHLGYLSAVAGEMNHHAQGIAYSAAGIGLILLLVFWRFSRKLAIGALAGCLLAGGVWSWATWRSSQEMQTRDNLQKLANAINLQLNISDPRHGRQDAECGVKQHRISSSTNNRRLGATDDGRAHC